MNNTDTITELHHYIDTILECAQSKSSKDVIEQIVELNKQASEEQWRNALDIHPEYEQLKKKFSFIYNDYIATMEKQQAQNLLSVNEGIRFEQAVSDDALAAYERVGDLFKHIQFNHTKSAIMIGSGQLPVTALHIYDRTEVENIVCLDILSESVTVANQLKEKFGWSKLHFKHCNGSEYDFSDADFIYIANMVRPKAQVLSRILDSCKPEAYVVVREPYGLGLLWAESSISALENKAKIIAYGEGSRFLSRDVFLKILS